MPIFAARGIRQASLYAAKRFSCAGSRRRSWPNNRLNLFHQGVDDGLYRCVGIRAAVFDRVDSVVPRTRRPAACGPAGGLVGRRIHTGSARYASTGWSRSSAALRLSFVIYSIILSAVPDIPRKLYGTLHPTCTPFHFESGFASILAAGSVAKASFPNRVW
jgi:hypothetical protein